ncbi:MAG TPA: InlB B-repeat-containing protein, partial [Pseudolysinimonas sp.]|nr:InlB B-repeat-containing protein [Pseudolysinimonas sp.]
VDRTANTITFYVDGAQTAVSAAGALSSSTALNSGLAFNIGGLSGSEADTGDGYTNAYIDDFEFFNAAIPATQVSADYAATKPVVVAYTVAFDGNGATAGTVASQSMVSNQPAALAANAFTRAGYQFRGWATSTAGPAVYADGQTVSALSSTDGATVTLYAVWNRFRSAGDTIAPIVSYDFDADSGSRVTDSSGNGNTGTWSGTASYGAGVSGKAATVNSPEGSVKGVNFFSLPLIAGKTDGSSSFSYVLWLNESSTSSDSPIVSNQDFTHCYDKGTTLYNTSGQPGVLRACFGQNGSSTVQNYLPNVSSDSVIGSWHQVAVVADRGAGTMTTYLDGQESASSNALTSAFTLTSGFPFRVGAEGSGADTVDGFVNAAIDDFDFYAAPISAAQIQNEYLATRPAVVPADDGSSLDRGFVSDTFRAPQVRTGRAVSQPLAGLWNGAVPSSFTKVDGDDWLSVDATGTVTGTAPASAPQDPAAITVRATDGTTTSTISVEIPVIGAQDAPTIASATWNLWDAGSHVSDSTLKDLAVIAAHGLDVIGLQEDGGTTAIRLANALGWYGIEGDGGVGIVSAYPLDVASEQTLSAAAPAIGVTAHVLGSDLRLWSVGLDGGAYGPETACQGGVTDPARLASAEKATLRFSQAQTVATAIAADVATARKTPVVMLGDLESPSAADWISATSKAHCGVGAVDWPVPDLLTAAGLTDSFRAAHPDPAASPGNTWSSIVTTNAADGSPEPQDRVDYIDYAGSRIGVLGSNTLVAGWPSAQNVQDQSWTSDHRGVVTTFRLDAPLPAPVVTVASATVEYPVGSHPSDAELLAKVGAASTTAGAVLAIDDRAVDFAVPGSYPASVTATNPADGQVSAPVRVTVKVVAVLSGGGTDAPAPTDPPAAHPGSGIALTGVDAGLPIAIAVLLLLAGIVATVVAVLRRRGGRVTARRR